MLLVLVVLVSALPVETQKSEPLERFRSEAIRAHSGRHLRREVRFVTPAELLRALERRREPDADSGLSSFVSSQYL
jgi:hypothetical protein